MARNVDDDDDGDATAEARPAAVLLRHCVQMFDDGVNHAIRYLETVIQRQSDMGADIRGR